ncbi:HAMP domain-containing protein [Agrobacterium vitis]|uniref:HAMP domain-containing protein n=1 Tax=Agrobacterium vitis TaxID=373 RepID=A0ABD6G989_AGRVI|nr:methyl-accepting chemotaxis protein [Agrobacterium vitis]MUO79175.1 HAMP domain-containing protein [Agrobacterium vitis]MUO95493.1 HAMP domain-containing protein [Agrobacterium vitis]MUP05937.1 HAMP domain-containing protein [Agrobacterium vitis]MUZ83021.1 HAMP domain-containing protein [Agrobacterium vitis]MVA11605.1 HAMP domain-containing protein [Agrobacterium vitis]
MSFLSNITIAKKIYIASGLGVAMVVGMVANQQWTNSTIKAAQDIVLREQTVLDGISASEKAFVEMKSGVRNIMLAPTAKEVDDELAAVNKSALNGQNSLKEAMRVAENPSALQAISTGLGDYATASIKIKDFVKEQRAQQSQDLVALTARRDQYTRPITSKLNESIQSAVAASRKVTTDARSSLQATEARSSTINGMIQILIVLVLIATAFVLRSTVVLPIKMLVEAMHRLSSGDTTRATDFGPRRDEIGLMCDAVEVFREDAVAKRQLEADAEAGRLRLEEQRKQAQLKAEEDARERLMIATSGLATGLKRLADGDLTIELRDAFSEEFEGLRHDFNQSVRTLGHTMGAILESVSNINNGSTEIASGAGDLSKRTEQQAASLEETSAALDEITVNVSNSAKRTQEARAVVIEANKAARQSGQVVANAVDAMQRIEASSSQISNIIGVIDEIAFQTNLLALNAGVEAARAGEAGKGFAVVAQEVRELAQRSAQAAKEIKELIRNSSEEVGNGVTLVRDTGNVLKTIEDYVSTANGHMDAIATSAQEQSVGLTQVNSAVNHMDQMTQQNAAMVEETTAASASLAGEVNKLRQLLGQFQIGRSAGNSGMSYAA